MLNLEQITKITDTFLDATVADADWHHAEHIIAGLELIRRHGREQAIAEMRKGIFGLLTAFGADHGKYHETLTVFWINALADYMQKEKDLSFEEICDKAVAIFPPSYAKEFYSKAVLDSEAARTNFVAPDIS